MDHHEWLAAQFTANRPRLHAVAYRMLGSLSEADDAVQETWLHLSRADRSDVANLSGWLTTVTARLCLDMLRARTARREESLDAQLATVTAARAESDPEHEALLAEAVGLALLVVLETLTPAERLAFVLHDIFAVPFTEIASLVGRSPTAARQLASRARRRVRGVATVPAAEFARQREVVAAFLAASRAGDFAALLTVLDPDVVFRADRAAVQLGGSAEVAGAAAVASAFTGRAQDARPALIDGMLGIVVAPRGRLVLALALTIVGGKIVTIAAIADPARLRQLALATVESSS